MLLLVCVLFFTDFLHSMDVNNRSENTDCPVRIVDDLAFNKVQLEYSKRAQQVFEKKHIYFYDPIAKDVMNFRYNGFLENYCLEIKRFDQFVDFTSIKNGFCEKDLLYCKSLIELFKRVEKMEDAVLERKKIVYNFKLFLYRLQNTDDDEVKEKAYNIFLTFMKKHCADHEKILSRQQACAGLVNLFLTGSMSSLQLADFVWDFKKSSPADVFILPLVICVSWMLLFGMFLFDNYKLNACVKIILELQSRARNSQDMNEKEMVSLVENNEETATE